MEENKNKYQKENYIIPKLNKFGFMVNIKEMAEKLIQARINAGLKHGFMWADGSPKPMTQTQAAKEIDVSIKKLWAVENERSGFTDKYQEQRAIDFINSHSGKTKKAKK